MFWYFTIPLCRWAALIKDCTLNPLTPKAAHWRQCLCHHWSKKWLGAKSAPIHFLNQCWLLIEKTPRNNLMWNSCLILRIPLKKIEMKLSSVFSCHISSGLNVLNDFMQLLSEFRQKYREHKALLSSILFSTLFHYTKHILTNDYIIRFSC